jgi:hypothetical protein
LADRPWSLAQTLINADSSRTVSPELFYSPSRITQQEMSMKAYLSQLSPLAWVGVSIPLLVLAHTVFIVVVPAVIRAVVPDTVRAVLHIL